MSVQQDRPVLCGTELESTATQHHKKLARKGALQQSNVLALAEHTLVVGSTVGMSWSDYTRRMYKYVPQGNVQHRKLAKSTVHAFHHQATHCFPGLGLIAASFRGARLSPNLNAHPILPDASADRLTGLQFSLPPLRMRPRSSFHPHLQLFPPYTSAEPTSEILPAPRI